MTLTNCSTESHFNNWFSWYIETFSCNRISNIAILNHYSRDVERFFRKGFLFPWILSDYGVTKSTRLTCIDLNDLCIRRPMSKLFGCLLKKTTIAMALNLVIYTVDFLNVFHFFFVSKRLFNQNLFMYVFSMVFKHVKTTQKRPLK